MIDAKSTVFVVDDDAQVRAALGLLIDSVGLQAEMFGSAREFLARPRIATPSCLLLDAVLPDMNGCDLQPKLADRVEMPIIFISGQGDVPMTARAMKAGAIDFFTKPFVNDMLLAAVHGALQRSRAMLLAAEQQTRLSASYASLSRRQREVMALVVVGRMNKQVGGELGISEITVKAHRGQIMRKMNAGSLPELVRMADNLARAGGVKP
jgi:FixJ family two-component response regulator